MLDYPRGDTTEEKPVNGGQPFGSHHDQVCVLIGSYLQYLFSRIAMLTENFGRKSFLNQFLCALFDQFPARLLLLEPPLLNPGTVVPTSTGARGRRAMTWITLT